MEIIKQQYLIISKIDGLEMIKNIEYAGRTCYKSEDKITDLSAETFVKMLIKRGHESVLEHEKITVKLITNRGVSHELVRHRLASYSQESTRYCNYGHKNKCLTFILPVWFYNENYNIKFNIWVDAMAQAETSYLTLIDMGMEPEKAREVLPNSLKTEIVVTANLREWRLILKQRTSNKAHPQIREIMLSILHDFKSLIPVVFDDLYDDLDYLKMLDRGNIK